MAINQNVYFAADSAENCVEYLTSKSEQWYSSIYRNRYLEKILTSWSYYYGGYYGENHQISFGGESGELVNLPVNHFRNFGEHILNIVTGSKPSWQCQSVNTDRKSMIQAELGNNILAYYMKDKRLERVYRKATEFAIVMGSGYVLQEWNSTKGGVAYEVELREDDPRIVSYDEQGRPVDEDGNVIHPTPVYRGDIEAKAINPLEVFFDQTKSDSELNDWYVVRTFVNKFDLIAKYPELREEILRISTEEFRFKRVTVTPYDATVDIPVYQLFHRETEALPKGRYLYYINSKIVLDDTILPYPELPIKRISHSDILGTSLGYTSLFDLIPMQEALNSVYSTVITNHHAFGVQNVLNPIGNGISITEVSGGMKWIEYDQQVGKPEALQLTKSSQESYNLIPMILKDMETLSGVNSVARGNPEASLKSGTALALIQSQALQFMNGFQQTYMQLLEDCGTFLINLLKEFADEKRVIAIAGISNTSKMKEFNNNDIDSINRVAVGVGNPLMATTAGRWQVAEQMIQMGIITTPEKILELLNTGSLENLTKSTTDQLDVVRAENEALLKGDPVIAWAMDKHSIHIREHVSVISDPVLRFDQDLVNRVTAHIMEHINLLADTDPRVLQIIGEQPLPPAGMPPQGGQPQQPTDPNQSGGMEVLDQPETQAAPGMPSPANPPQGFENLPQTPEELAMSNQGM